jgi:hypothetical protein
MGHYRTGSLAVVRAFIERKPRKIKNDETGGTALYFHGNEIAVWRDNGDLLWTLAGYGTYTTRLRLNQLFSQLGLPFSLCQRHGEQYLHHSGTNESREISTHTIYTVDAFDIAAMKHLNK